MGDRGGVVIGVGFGLELIFPGIIGSGEHFSARENRVLKTGK